MSCLAALAEIDGRVESLFNTREVNAAGIYSFNFYINGKLQEVVVDEYIPCDPANGLPCFGYSADMGEIWAMLIEKAWAKLHGSYCMTRKGSSVSTLPHMTGAPSLQYDHNYVEELEAFWNIIQDADERNYIVTSSTHETCLNQAGGHEKRRLGIVSGHSYTLLSTHAFKHAGQRVKLLKLRNPHGNTEWEGDWSDESPLWTPKLR